MVEENGKTSAGRRDRRFRLKQLKKILPSDRVTVEKNYPRFYQKCQSNQLRQNNNIDEWNVENLIDIDRSNSPTMITTTTTTTTDTVEAIQDNLGKSSDFHLTHLNHQQQQQHLEENGRNIDNGYEDDIWSSASSDSTVREENQKNKIRDLDQSRWERERDQGQKKKHDQQGLVVPMADHLEEMTLQRGCWLQATLSGRHRQQLGEQQQSQQPQHQQPSSTIHYQQQQQQQQQQQDMKNEKPKIVFIHRKKSPSESSNQMSSRIDLAMEVLHEFQRQKQLVSRRCNSLEETEPPLDTFQRSHVYHQSLPIYQRTLINLQSRRVS